MPESLAGHRLASYPVASFMASLLAGERGAGPEEPRQEHPGEVKAEKEEELDTRGAARSGSEYGKIRRDVPTGEGAEGCQGVRPCPR